MTENAYADGNQIKDIVKYMSDNCDGGGGGSSEVIYSPEEQEIGEWREEIDDVLKKKPLYQKTFLGTFTATTNVVSTSDLSIERLVNYSGTLLGADGYIINIERAYSTISQHFVDVFTNPLKTEMTISVGSYYSTGTKEYNLTIRYTKSTDAWENA